MGEDEVEEVRGREGDGEESQKAYLHIRQHSLEIVKDSGFWCLTLAL